MESYLRIVSGGPDARRQLLNEDQIRTALAVGSPDLMDAVNRGGARKQSDRVDSSLLRYLIRMSSRPTPYGMFAGVALTTWGEQTTTVLSGPPFTSSRPDMAWLTDLLTAAAQDQPIRHRLQISANRSLAIRGGRVFIVDQPRSASTSVRATAAVRHALHMATKSIAYDDLTEALLQTPGATPGKVATLLDEMLRQSLLFTELRPSLVTTDPAGRALNILRNIPEAHSRASDLADILEEIVLFDRAAPAAATTAYGALTARATALQPGSANPIQVDLGWPLTGTITARVGDAAVQAAEVLLALSPAPGGPAALQSYKHAFLTRYGHQRIVPILDLVDPAVGLGPPAGGGHGNIPAERSARRSRRLLTLAVDALRDGQTAIELTTEDIDELRTADPGEHPVPLSLELSLFVLAESVEDINSGHFRLVIGPNLGAPAAGRNLGRFASILGPAAVQALREVADSEAQLLPDHIFAEVAYTPSRPRSANVAVRPPIRPFLIVSALGNAPDGTTHIPLDELSIGLRDDRLRVIWTRDGTEVIPCAGHMLNTRGAPAAVALLNEIAGDGYTQIGLFDWGTANMLPVLPRVTYQGLVLRPAQWTLDRSALRIPVEDKALETFSKRFDAWRRKWSPPRAVYLAYGDNRLLLDLDQPDNRAEIRRELANLHPGRSLTLHEALPGPEHAWLPGPAGRHLCELVVPLVRSPQPQPITSNVFTSLADSIPPRPLKINNAARLKLPGSEWLYVKLYLPADIEDDVITGPLQEFTNLSILTGAADSWFFLRYSDPLPHLRIRFRGEPERLTDTLLPLLFRWAAKLHEDQLCTTLVVDTYDREIERYGGLQGVEIAESIHCADSQAVPDLLDAATSAQASDRLSVAVLSINDLLTSLGYDIPRRICWLQEQVHNRRLSGTEYRLRGNTLRNLLNGSATLAVHSGSQGLDALAARHRAVEPLGAKLSALEKEGCLTTPMDNIVRDLIHLHCNRLLGRNTAEELPLGLLLRSWQGLQHR